MSDFNRVIIEGRLTRPPEMRTIPGTDTKVCDLHIACNREIKIEEKWEQFPVYIKVTQWNKNAERAMEKFSTGDRIIVEGELVDDNFEKGDSKTSGRLKVDHARVKMLAKAQPKTN